MKAEVEAWSLPAWGAWIETYRKDHSTDLSECDSPVVFFAPIRYWQLWLIIWRLLTFRSPASLPSCSFLVTFPVTVTLWFKWSASLTELLFSPHVRPSSPVMRNSFFSLASFVKHPVAVSS